jgi:hypothetical protein
VFGSISQIREVLILREILHGIKLKPYGQDDFNVTNECITLDFFWADYFFQNSAHCVWSKGKRVGRGGNKVTRGKTNIIIKIITIVVNRSLFLLF